MVNALNSVQQIYLDVNNHQTETMVRNAETLLFTLRERLGCMSVKSGCENGDCGSCTVLINEQPIQACHMLTVEAQHCKIKTIEGIENSVIQNDFIENNAIQCGYCTPGFILNCYALINNEPNADEKIINEWLDSNICRCTGYQEIKTIVKNRLKANKVNE